MQSEQDLFLLWQPTDSVSDWSDSDSDSGAKSSFTSSLKIISSSGAESDSRVVFALDQFAELAQLCFVRLAPVMVQRHVLAGRHVVPNVSVVHKEVLKVQKGVPVQSHQTQPRLVVCGHLELHLGGTEQAEHVRGTRHVCHHQKQNVTVSDDYVFIRFQLERFLSLVGQNIRPVLGNVPNIQPQ
ncbi:hypothetical protein OGAPHI_003239 [Ogataea philodendri]|uniref:Uncharacterized protein n=1 Tax=Ogataea philodendri TaxID=1378263 RepID=A0A9P8P864_9ASCO|nr:uncharacterized protein OGAPHI_003239 [Ogataea philodendri]KAH3666790.1 hypothetical protein OGAPHI_003239 [Ogataea philodendri]